MTTWTTPTTFTPDEVLTDAHMNAIGDNLNVLGGAWTSDGRSAATIWSGTLGSGGSISSNYQKIGVGGGVGYCNWEVLITLGTGFTIGTGLTLPVTAKTAGGVFSSQSYVFDASGTSYAVLAVAPSTTTAAVLRTTSGSAYVPISSSAPITFAASDILWARITYRI